MPTISFHPATKERQEQIIEKLDALASDIAPIGHVPIHVKTVSGDTVTLRWSDPADRPRSTWQKTVVVKKQGSAPLSPDDGITVITSTVRDAYAKTGYEDAQTGGDGWVYRAFPYSAQGAVNLSADNIFTGYELYEFSIDESLTDPYDMVSYDGTTADSVPISIDKTANPSPSAINWGTWRNAFFIPKPCMLGLDGTVAYYLDEEDYGKKADGTASDISDLSFQGNAMMEFPCVYMSAKKQVTRISIKISSAKLDDSFECFPCLKADGSHSDAFYMPIYEGYQSSGVMRSMCVANSKCNSGAAQSNQVSWARANGQGWDVTTFAQEELVKALGVLVFKTLDVPSECGGSRSSTASSTQINFGGGNTFGMFGGKFDGSWTTCKFFGMENWWGHVNRRVLGCNLSSLEWTVKMTKHTGDGSGSDDYTWSDTASDYASKYIATGLKLGGTSSGAYITSMFGELSASGERKISAVFLPSGASGGGSAAKYCDGFYSSNNLTGVLFGGAAAHGPLAGLFSVNALRVPSYSDWGSGASLSYTRF